MWAERSSARCSRADARIERAGSSSMSRVGKKPVPIPSGVTAVVEGQTVKVKGPKGALSLVLHGDVAAKVEKGEVKVDPRAETKRARAMWGTYRSLLENVMTGVTKGFERTLEISGIGYRAALQGKKLPVQLGSSQATLNPIPKAPTHTAPTRI